VDFYFPGMTPVQTVVAFVAVGFAIGMAIHWIAKCGTAARWALSASS